ncbi:MAG: DUF1800 domain-containing protein [Flavobacteriales bacterium]|nr:DUF1800 domain-containing protein [Flavobacteriales bacterium]MCB9203766.1 DUF1800 domain-containing protein [Flavobacteriales bacterium]
MALPAPPACDLDGIAAYTPSQAKPWNEERVKHLYRRLGFGADLATQQAALGMDPLVLVDSLVDAAVNLPPTTTPAWGNWDVSDYSNIGVEGPNQVLEWYAQFVNDMLDNGLRDKLTLFWSNHFVTELDVYQCPSYMFQYYNMLQTHALGNFKDFVHAVGISNAMIVYLNSYENTSISPNENYARELYELFTLGENNGYTQNDIVETAKALTGYNGFTEICAPITFNSAFHSNDNKTIFGQTGNWGYDDVIDILFTEREGIVANFICTKLYKYFVSPVVDQSIVDALALTFLMNNYEIAPVLRQLFKSEHFFDEDVIGVKIKSPMEMMVGFIKEGGFAYDETVINGTQYYGGLLGQQLFNPTDVAGWQGNHEWINTSTITGRWLIIDYFCQYSYTLSSEQFRTFATDLVGGPTTNADLVAQKIIDHFLPRGLETQAEYDQAIAVFKDVYPSNYYTLGLWNTSVEFMPYQALLLLLHISHLPEFQLT